MGRIVADPADDCQRIPLKWPPRTAE